MRPSARRGAAASALALAAGLGAGACGPTPPERPSLVLITADSLRPDQLVCYEPSAESGSEACGLAERGVLYEWAFTPAPSGAPAAASLLSSTYPSQHRVADEPSSFLPYLGPPVLGESLRRGGYATAAFVASAELNRSRAFDRGFDHFDDRAPRAGEADPPTLVEKLRAWTRGTAAPWFVWIHLAEAHGPFDARDRRRYRSEYAAAVRRLDRQLARVLAWLESDAPDAGILLTALHGQSLGETRRTPLGHGSSLAPAQIRVPLLWRPPRSAGGAAAGRRSAGAVSLLDVAPTLVEAAGLARPPEFEGRPLSRGDDADAEPAPRTLFAELPDAVAVIRDGGIAVYPRLLVPSAEQRPASAASTPVERWYPLDSGSAAERAAHGPSAAAVLDALRGEVTSLPLDW